jgi:hypothetical protein
VLDTPVPGYLVKTTWRALLLSYSFVMHAKMIDATLTGKKWGEAITTAQYEIRLAKNEEDRAYWTVELKRLQDGFAAAIKDVETERGRLGALERACKVTADFHWKSDITVTDGHAGCGSIKGLPVTDGTSLPSSLRRYYVYS